MRVCGNLVGNNIFTFRETVGRCRQPDSDSKTSLIPKDGLIWIVNSFEFTRRKDVAVCASLPFYPSKIQGDLLTCKLSFKAPRPPTWWWCLCALLFIIWIRIDGAHSPQEASISSWWMTKAGDCFFLKKSPLLRVSSRNPSNEQIFGGSNNLQIYINYVKICCF